MASYQVPLFSRYCFLFCTPYFIYVKISAIIYSYLYRVLKAVHVGNVPASPLANTGKKHPQKGQFGSFLRAINRVLNGSLSSTCRLYMSLNTPTLVCPIMVLPRMSDGPGKESVGTIGGVAKKQHVNGRNTVLYNRCREDGSVKLANFESFDIIRGKCGVIHGAGKDNLVEIAACRHKQHLLRP
jgi:hypothetical protein